MSINVCISIVLLDNLNHFLFEDNEREIKCFRKHLAMFTIIESRLLVTILRGSNSLLLYRDLKAYIYFVTLFICLPYICYAILEQLCINLIY